jgi:hypothetical protein
MIHWDAHEMAFKRLTHSHQLSTAKLIHELAKTNVQNHKYYNKSPTCPWCSTMDKPFSHVLSCSSTLSTEHRNQALQELRKDLQCINTPSDVIEALCHGTNMWLHRQTDPDYVVRALTAGSHKGTDMLLTMAFNEQFHTIGWHNLFYGRLSILWGRAVSQLTTSTYSSLSTTWTAQSILYLWKYLRSIWMHRNQVVHGKTDQEIADKIRASTHDRVRTLYATFRSNPDFILSRHHYLFTNRSLTHRLNLDIESLQCWLRSVKSVQQDLEHHNTNLRLQSNRFFAPFYAIGRARHQTSSSSSDSTYSPSSQASITATEDMASLEATLDSWENTTVSMSTLSNSTIVNSSTTSTTSTLGTFITTGSSDPPPLHH